MAAKSVLIPYVDETHAKTQPRRGPQLRVVVRPPLNDFHSSTGGPPHWPFAILGGPRLHTPLPLFPGLRSARPRRRCIVDRRWPRGAAEALPQLLEDDVEHWDDE